jgi:hypothetical protein
MRASRTEADQYDGLPSRSGGAASHKINLLKLLGSEPKEFSCPSRTRNLRMRS